MKQKTLFGLLDYVGGLALTLVYGVLSIGIGVAYYRGKFTFEQAGSAWTAIQALPAMGYHLHCQHQETHKKLREIHSKLRQPKGK